MPLMDATQKMDTGSWLFHKPTQHTKLERRHSTEWHNKIGTLRPMAYKDMVASGLPPLESRATRPNEKKHKMPDYDKKSAVYTRFTQRQHTRRDSVERLTEIINTPKGLYNKLSKTLSPQRQEHLERVFMRFPTEGDGKIALDMPTHIYEELSDALNETSFGSTQADYHSLKSARLRDKIDILEIERGDQQQRKSVIEPLKNVDELLSANTNPYMFMAKKEKEKDRGLKKKKKAKQTEQNEHPWGTPEELHMKAVVQDFSEWVFDLGGEFDNIDESTLANLFSGGYDTSPAMFMPVTTVPKSDLPADLIDDNLLELPSRRTSLFPTKKAKHTSRRGGKDTSTFKPFRFGAWYLDPKAWRKMDLDEQLQDPNQLKEGELSEVEMRRQELNEELAELFIPGAFMDYLKWKHARIPSFLLEVADIRLINERQMRENAAEGKSSQLFHSPIGSRKQSK